MESASPGEIPSPLPRGRGALPPTVVRESQRRRLLRAMAEQAGTKGLADLTIADLAATAGVAKKSFYALFRDKTDCYLAAHSEHARRLLQALTGPLAHEPDPVDGLRAALRAYLELLHEEPLHARAFLWEASRAGPLELAAHRASIDRLAGAVAGHQRRLRKARPEAGSVSDRAVLATLTGINELVCRELDGREKPNIRGLETEVVRFVLVVLGLPPEAEHASA